MIVGIVYYDHGKYYRSSFGLTYGKVLVKHKQNNAKVIRIIVVYVIKHVLSYYFDHWSKLSWHKNDSYIKATSVYQRSQVIQK